MSEDKEVIGNLESQVRPSHYYRTEYDTKKRFISHWHQINEVINDIKEVGFKIERTYRVFEMPYHRFFVLRKQ